MNSFSIDSEVWAKQQFGQCNLGDARRTRRLVRVATQVANHPAGSIPQQMEGWKDVKGAYRLFNADDVTFDEITAPHREQTVRQPPGRYLILGDTTELDFGLHRQVPGLASIGNGSGQGFLLHTGLMVSANQEEVLGVAAHTIHYRQPVPAKETPAHRLKRERESRVWGDVIDQVGSPPDGVEFVHVLDAGADNFEVFCHVLQQKAHCVTRVAQKQRNVITPQGVKLSLKKFVGSLPVGGTYELFLRARTNQPARTATLEVRFGSVELPVPACRSPYVRKLGLKSIPMWVVWVKEKNAPRGIEPIEWILYTSVPVKSFADAWTVIEYFERRWLIEEYHKALKSGCSVTKRQLKTKDRLEAIVGLLSVVAVRLLQLKSIARTDPDRPARQVIPLNWIQMLRAVRKPLPPLRDLTVAQFYRELAKLGGFLGRKSDGEPGWITTWRGWEKLHLMLRGAELVAATLSNARKCG